MSAPLSLLRRAGVPAAAAGVVAVTGAAAVGLHQTVDAALLASAWRAAGGAPSGVALALGAFAAAFALRALAWHRVLPSLPLGHALSAICLALGANHILPLRLGEPLRVVAATRRGGVAPADALASTISLRLADVLALLLLGVAAGPTVLAGMLGPAAGVAIGALAATGVLLLGLLARRRAHRGDVRPPGPAALALTATAWLLEAVVVWQVTSWVGLSLTAADALVVLAAAVGAQVVAIGPGGIGTYEVAAATALVAVGADPAVAVSAAVAVHAVKTVASLVLGGVAMVLPAPPIWGRLRLPRARPSSLSHRPPATGPVLLFLPAHDEGPRVAEVVRRAPTHVRGFPLRVLVVDDGSRDDTAERARGAGAEVVGHGRNRGLGAAVRTGLAEAVRRDARAVAFCDADGEYDPAEIDRLAGPILDGVADYVVGSRFAGRIHRMRLHRRLGNRALTAWVRWTVRAPVSDGQSGYRAFSPAAAAAAHIAHDYNYAQVLTIDLLARGARYLEVGIDYRCRESGRSFVRPGSYLRRVLPTVWRLLNPTSPRHREA